MWKVATQNEEEAPEEMTEAESDSQWLCHYFHLEDNDELFTQLKNFVLFWGLFEKEYFNKHCHDNELAEWVPSFTLESHFVNICISQLREWYLNPDGTVNHYLIDNKLYHDAPKGTKDALEEGLESDNDTLQVRAIIIAIYRYRNNLFHGEKDIATNAPHYHELFAFANRFLRKCLEQKNTVK